jgi:hypothetical protein
MFLYIYLNEDRIKLRIFNLFFETIVKSCYEFIKSYEKNKKTDKELKKT